MSADPPLAVLSPLLSCQQIHLSLSCLHFCRVSRSTSLSPVSTFIVSADSPLAVLSPLTFVVSADPLLSVLSPLLLCQQIHLSLSCLHFCRVSRSTSLGPVSTFVVSADSPLAVLCLHFSHVNPFLSSRMPHINFSNDHSFKTKSNKLFSEATLHKDVNTCIDDEKEEIINVRGMASSLTATHQVRRRGGGGKGRGVIVATLISTLMSCSPPPDPEWGSLNHGCVLCIECSGVHRNLGSVMCSCSPESRAVMLHIGNKISRDLWEAKKLRTVPFTPHRETRERDSSRPNM